MVEVSEDGGMPTEECPLSEKMPWILNGYLNGY